MCLCCSSVCHLFALLQEPTASRLLTIHNLTYMFDLCKGMRQAISENRYPEFVKLYLRRQFRSALIESSNPDSQTPSNPNSVQSASSKPTFSEYTSLESTESISTKSRVSSTAASTSSLTDSDEMEAAPCPPVWVRDALLAGGIDIHGMYNWDKAQTDERCGLTPHDEKLTIPKTKEGKRSRMDAELTDERQLKKLRNPDEKAE